MRKLLLAAGMACVLMASGCKPKQKTNAVPQTRTTGTLTLGVDATIAPLLQQEKELFEPDYREAKITLAEKSEAELLHNWRNLRDSGVIVLARAPREAEMQNFKAKQTPVDFDRIAVDGIAFLVSKDYPDSVITAQQVTGLLNGKSKSGEILLFDDKGSSLLRYFTDKYKLDRLDGKTVQTGGGVEDIINRAAADKSKIAVVSSIWLYSKDPALNAKVAGMNCLKLGSADKPGSYYKPTTDNILEDKYIYIRNIYYVNAERREGLGTGFANFISSPRGQKIVYRSGIAPHELAVRELRYLDKTTN